jgi:hypothetical protein
MDYGDGRVLGRKALIGLGYGGERKPTPHFMQAKNRPFSR